MKELIDYTDRFHLIGSKMPDKGGLSMKRCLEHSGQYLCYNHFSPQPFDYLQRSPQMAYNEIIREHEVKPGIYINHPQEGPESCQKDQMQFLFFAILLSSDSDRAFITLLRIITRFMFWQDWRKTHLKALMLPSDISPLVRTLIKSNKKYLVLYPILVLGDFMLTFTTIWKSIRRKSLDRTKILNLHAKLASSRHVPTIFTYLNNWLYNKQDTDITNFYYSKLDPPIANNVDFARYEGHNILLTHAQKNLAYLGLILHLALTSLILWSLYISINKLSFANYDKIKQAVILKVCQG